MIYFLNKVNKQAYLTDNKAESFVIILSFVIRSTFRKRGLHLEMGWVSAAGTQLLPEGVGHPPTGKR